MVRRARFTSIKSRSIALFFLALVAGVVTAGCNSGRSWNLPWARDKPDWPALESVPEALAVIRDSDNPVRRREAFRYLGKPSNHSDVGQQSIDESVQILSLALGNEPDSYSKLAIIHALGQLKHAKSAEALIVALEDEDPAVREASGRVLKQFPSDEAALSLGRLLRNDTNVDVRLAAADSLGAMPYPAAAEALLDGLGDSDVALQFRCSESLTALYQVDHGINQVQWQREISGAKVNSAPRNRWLDLIP